MKKIVAQHHLNFSDNQSQFELSVGQFADFFQISNISNSRRILRQIYNSPEKSACYKNFKVKVSYLDGQGQYIATVSPLNSSPLVTPPCGHHTFDTSLFNSDSRKASNDGSDNFEKLSKDFSEPFCDWMTIHQRFPFKLPELNGGCVVSLNSIPQNSDGNFNFLGDDVEFMTTKYISHKGSYETNLQLRVDVDTLTLSGNVGRFGRPDNLFGFSILDCVKKANRIIDSLRLGLPNFSAGSHSAPRDIVVPCKKTHPDAYVVSTEKRTSLLSGREYDSHSYGYIKTHKHNWDGAWFSQLHLTKNLLFQSIDETKLFMDWACRQNPFGMSVHPHYGQGVNYGKGSRYLSPKLYLKGLEVQENKKYSKIPERYKDKLLNFINNKIVRFEINYKKFLSKNNIKFLGDIMNDELRNVLYVDFKNRLDKVLGSDVDFYENLEKLSRRRREQFFAWTRGADLESMYSPATYYRILREFNEKLKVNISLPYSEQHSILKIRTLVCQEITQFPEFYELNSEFDFDLKLIA